MSGDGGGSGGKKRRYSRPETDYWYSVIDRIEKCATFIETNKGHSAAISEFQTMWIRMFRNVRLMEQRTSPTDSTSTTWVLPSRYILHFICRCVEQFHVFDFVVVAAACTIERLKKPKEQNDDSKGAATEEAEEEGAKCTKINRNDCILILFKTFFCSFFFLLLWKRSIVHAPCQAESLCERESIESTSLMVMVSIHITYNLHSLECACNEVHMQKVHTEFCARKLM